MSASESVSALRVADEGFMVASTIERCPRTMMMRELFMNALEAAERSAGGKLVEFRIVKSGTVDKLCICNTGRGPYFGSPNFQAKLLLSNLLCL